MENHPTDEEEEGTEGGGGGGGGSPSSSPRGSYAHPQAPPPPPRGSQYQRRRNGGGGGTGSEGGSQDGLMGSVSVSRGGGNVEPSSDGHGHGPRDGGEDGEYHDGGGYTSQPIMSHPVTSCHILSRPVNTHVNHILNLPY